MQAKFDMTQAVQYIMWKVEEGPGADSAAEEEDSADSMHTKGAYVPTHDLPKTYLPITYPRPTYAFATHQMPQAKMLQEAIETLCREGQNTMSDYAVVCHLKRWLEFSTVHDMFHNGWVPHVVNHTLHFFFRALTHMVYNQPRFR